MLDVISSLPEWALSVAVTTLGLVLAGGAVGGYFLGLRERRQARPQRPAPDPESSRRIDAPPNYKPRPRQAPAVYRPAPRLGRHAVETVSTHLAMPAITHGRHAVRSTR